MDSLKQVGCECRSGCASEAVCENDGVDRVIRLELGLECVECFGEERRESEGIKWVEYIDVLKKKL